MDRNHVVLVVPAGCWLSLSARRAWIEIIDYIIDYAADAVALRKESVDRNKGERYHLYCGADVALRKESVDRNRHIPQRLAVGCRRSPQGERG